MKKLLGIVVLGLLLSSNAYAALNCNLKSDKLQDNYTNGSLEVSIYNPNSTTVSITGIMYYKDSALVRTYKVTHFVGAQKSLSFSHKTSTAFLKSTNGVNFDCFKHATQAEVSDYFKKNPINKKKSGFKWQYLLAIPIVLAVIGAVTGDKDKNKRSTSDTAVKKDNKRKKEELEQEQTGPRMTGTAFFIDKKGHLITNFHVVANSSNRLKVIHEGEEIKARIIAKDETLDLALLKVSIKNESYIEISDKVLKKMQSIVAAGYPHLHLSDDLKLTSGIISSLKGIGNNSALIQIDAALNPGNSGGPIVDKDKGHLAAVAVARMEGSHYQSINYGIKASRVKEFIESNSVTLPQEAPKTKKIKRKDISEVLENSTILIYH